MEKDQVVMLNIGNYRVTAISSSERGLAVIENEYLRVFCFSDGTLEVSDLKTGNRKTFSKDGW